MKDEIIKYLQSITKPFVTFYELKVLINSTTEELDSVLSELLAERKIKKQEGLNTTLYCLVK